MSTTAAAGWLALALAMLAVVPTVFVLGREAFRRVATRGALREVERARRLMGTDGATDMAVLTAALGKQFSPLTVERAVIQLLRAEEAENRAFGSRLFTELGLVARYSTRVREARKWSERTHAAEILGLAGAATAVPALVSALRDRFEDDASVKVAAAAALAKLRDPTAIPLLVKELKAVDERSSRNVAESLVAFGGLAVPALLELLVDAAYPSARVWAARVLGRIGDRRATDDLVTRLHDRDDLLRMAAAEALGVIGDGRALQPLVRATLRDPAPQVRAHAAGAVARIEGERAVDVLVAALADPDYATRLRALEAFETMRIEDTSSLEQALRDPNAEVRRRAALALERVGYVDRIIRELTSPERPVARRAYAALLELGRVGLIDSISSYVHHESFEVRAVAAKACGELGADRTAPLLLGALDDTAWPVRAAIAGALGHLRHPGAPAALVKLLSDPEEPVRGAAAEALTSYPPDQLTEYTAELAGAYDRGDVTIRTHMVVLLGRIAGDVATEVLIRAAMDPSDGVRLRAVSALGDRGGQVMVEPLVARLTDASLEVRMAAVAALGAAATTEAFEGLLRALGGAQIDVRDRIAEALSRGARDQLFARLDELTRNASDDVRIGVAWTLGKTGDAAGIPTLARFLNDSNARLRASAAGALAKIASPSACEALLDAAEDPDERVRAAVVNALGRTTSPPPRVMGALEQRTRDPDRFVRNRAIVSLARAGGASAEARVLALEAEETVERAALLVALGLTGTETALGRVLDALADSAELDRVVAFLAHEDEAVRSAFFGALRIEDPKAVGAPAGDAPVLISQYEHVLRTSLDVSARRMAVGALARLGAERALEVLANALAADPNETVRLQAAGALAPHANEASARKALARAIADPNAEVAVRALRALSGRREPDVLGALSRRLGAGTREVQDVVEATLADVHRADPMPFLDWMMGVDIPELLIPSIRVLHRMASPITLPLLRELSRSRSAEVRAHAVRALGELPLPDARAAIDERVQDPNEDVRIAVIDCMIWSPETLLRTAQLRRDPSVRVRTRAAAALDRVDGSTARAALKILDSMREDASPKVRAAALGTLMMLPDAEGIRTFARAWQEAPLDTRLELHAEPRALAISDRVATLLSSSVDPFERRIAVTALGALAAPGFHVHVLPALRDPSPDVRVAAVKALAPLDDAGVRARLAEMIADPDNDVRDAARRSMVHTVG